MAVAEKLLPPDTDLEIRPKRRGPLLAADFEAWVQDPDNPMELIEGWVVPMSPGNLVTGQLFLRLGMVLGPLVAERGWVMSLDARHRLAFPPETVVYPDLVIHCSAQVPYLPGTETVARTPDLVIELLSDETANRDRAPRGAKYLAYEMSGVQEYYYAWPDGSEAAGFRLEDGRFRPIALDAEGYFRSSLLGRSLRLVPPGLRS